MIFFLIILLIVISIGAVPSSIKEYNTDYLNKKNTAAINGIFVILVVFSHYSQYAAFSGVYDAPYLALREHLGQMVVVTFWFYSGYGMMEAIRRKGDVYVRGILSKFWKLLLRFDLAVLAFLVLGLALGREYTAQQILVSLIAYTNIGNSNWYIFDVLIEYLLMFAAFRLTSKLGRHSREAGVVLFFLLTIGFVYTLIVCGLPRYYYDTVIIMPVGALYSEIRKGIEKRIMCSDIAFSLTAMIVAGIYILSYFHRQDYGIEGRTAWALAFTSAVLLFTMKFRIYNPVLEWFGTHIFSVYILQRLPMMLLAKLGCIGDHKYISLAAVLAITIPLALIFEKATDRITAAIEEGTEKLSKHR